MTRSTFRRNNGRNGRVDDADDVDGRIDGRHDAGDLRHSGRTRSCAGIPAVARIDVLCDELVRMHMHGVPEMYPALATIIPWLAW